MPAVKDWSRELERVTSRTELDRERLVPALTRSRAKAIATDPGRVARTGSRVKEIRVMRGYTQMQLAAVIGTNVDTVRKAERGYLAQMKVTTVLRFANALGVGAADLFPLLSSKLDRKNKKRARG